MIVRPCPPAEFLHRAGPWLQTRESEHNLVLGIAGSLAATGGPPAQVGSPPGGPPFLATIEDGTGEVVAAAVRVPPHHLVVTRAPANALLALAEHLAPVAPEVTGVNGPVEAAEGFAAAWAARTGIAARVVMRLGVYESTRAIQPGVAGRFRLADAAHLELCVRWRRAFLAEAVPHHPEHGEDRSDETVRRLMAGNQIFLWVDAGEPKSMAVWQRPTPHGVCISAVYTPPEHRRRGHASACVAALTQCLLDQGRRSVCLFTDLANPTSNSIYVKVGFTSVCEFADHEFQHPAPGGG